MEAILDNQTKKKKPCKSCGNKKNKKPCNSCGKNKNQKEFNIKRSSKYKTKLILKSELSPGDICMLTATVRDLNKAHPNKFDVGVKTTAKEIWENNPYIKDLKEEDADYVIDMHYPLINHSNQWAYHFVHGYTKYLEEKLKLNIPVTYMKGDIYISDKEKSWINQIEEIDIKDDFWIINAGGKYDFTCIAEGSRILTKNGYKKIEDVNNKDMVLTEWGFKKCDGSIFKGNKKCINIKTKLNEIKCTKDHKFKVINKDGEIEWSEACHLKAGDRILGRLGSVSSNINNDLDLWFTIGRIWGDGCFRRNVYSLNFSNKEDKARKRVLNWLNRNNYKYTQKIKKPEGISKEKYYQVHISGNILKKYFPKYKKKGLWRKNGFLDIYNNLSKEEYISLIQGLFSSDGTIDKVRKNDKGTISFTSIYNNVSKDVQRVLWMLGVTSVIKKKSFISIWDKKCTYYKVSLLGSRSYNNFYKNIGFENTYKDNKLKKSKEFDTINDKFHGISNIKEKISSIKIKQKTELNKTRLFGLRYDIKKSNIIRDSSIDRIKNNFYLNDMKDLIENYQNNDWYFDEVISVKETKKQYKVYDILNSETESFVVEGLVAHNCKFWHPDWYQEVIDHFQGRITFVQVGQKKHWHPQLKNCINLIDKTNLRQLIRLVYHSIGVLTPISLPMHLAAAVEMKNHKKRNRPCVVISGGREPPQWEAYPHHRFLSVNGSLSCCDNGGCWKSRCTKINDNDPKNESLCLFPITIGKTHTKYPTKNLQGELSLAKCMYMIKPSDVIRAIESYYEGDLYKYGSSLSKDIPEKAKKYINLK